MTFVPSNPHLLYPHAMVPFRPWLPHGGAPNPQPTCKVTILVSYQLSVRSCFARWSSWPNGSTAWSWRSPFARCCSRRPRWSRHAGLHGRSLRTAAAALLLAVLDKHTQNHHAHKVGLLSSCKIHLIFFASELILFFPIVSLLPVNNGQELLDV